MSIPCCHESTFVKETLLPELAKRGIRNFPLDLIAILYTLGVPSGVDECTFLSAVVDSNSVTLLLQFQYNDNGQLWSYCVHNFEKPEISEHIVVN
jgi:hypothetical protein